MRKGQIVGLVGKFVGLAITLVVVASIIYLIVERNKQEVNNLQSCGGLIGSLGGGEGYCHADKTCTSATAKSGFYWQYVGEGMGCGKEDPSKKICCIEVQSNKAPIRASDVAKAKCQEDNSGKLVAVLDDGECYPDSNTIQTVGADQSFDMRYYYDKARDVSPKTCSYVLKIENMEFVISNTCPRGTGTYTALWGASVQQFLKAKNEDANANNNVDMAWLNKQTTATFTLTIDGRSASHTLNVLPQSPKICGWISTSATCRGLPEGAKTIKRVTRESLDYTIHYTCQIDANSACREVQTAEVETTSLQPITCKTVELVSNSVVRNPTNQCQNKRAPCYVIMSQYTYYACTNSGKPDTCTQTPVSNNPPEGMSQC